MTIEIRTSANGHKYFLENGKRLPSPSSIANRFKDSGGLLYWANQQGLEGRTLQEAQQAAVTPGTIAHSRIECDIRGHEFDTEQWMAKTMAAGLDVDDVMGKVNSSWNAYCDWRDMTKMKPISAELTLVSETHGFGGTLDSVEVTSGTYLADWKTGALYPDHLIQMAGYIILWEENMSQQLDGVMLLSISKEEIGFTQKVYPRKAMNPVCAQFLRLLDAYRADKLIKKMV